VRERSRITRGPSGKAVSPPAVGGARGNDAAVVALQSKIGNRATAQLLRQPTAKKEAKPGRPGTEPRYEGEEVEKWEFAIASAFRTPHRRQPDDVVGKPQMAFVGDTLEVRATFRGRPDHARLRAGGDGDLKAGTGAWENATTYVQTFRLDGAGKHALEAWVAGPTLKSYSVKHSFDVVVHERWRAGLERQVDDWYNVIQKLKAERINAWEKNARIPQSKIALDILMAVIAIVSLGIGGIAYGVIEELLKRTTITSKALIEFTELAGLEFADLVAEKAFHEGLDLAKTDLEKGIASAGDKRQIEKNARAALATKTDAIDAFVEGMKLQTISEEAESHKAFNASAASRSDEDLLYESAAQQQLYDALARHPERFEQELTIGVIRMLDEAQLASAAKDKDRDPTKREDRRKTFEEDRELHSSWYRVGNLVVFPESGGRDGIGKWEHPDLGFTGFEVQGGGVNKQTLHTLEGATIEDLKVTTAFTFSAHDPYDYLLQQGDLTSLTFVRSADGDFYVPGSTSDSPGEWLASYYTRRSEEHSDSERELFAPMGAKKLYEAVKRKKVTDVTWRKV
jgi:hypothetical protein